MKTIGFIMSEKKDEYRRAILPKDLKNVKNKNQLYFENGYGAAFGIDDQNYIDEGCNIDTRENILKKDIICDPKIGDSDYLKELTEGQIIFGWVHAVQNRDITDILIENKLTAFAWEDMHEKGRHSFWRNNEIAGEAAIMHAYQCHNIMPYDTKVAVLGKGNIARGAIKILNQLGADVTVYDRRMESLFQEELPKYDVIVNGILWDTNRNDHIVYKSDLSKMKNNAMIIDISCDRNGGIETSIPTSIKNPTYEVNGIKHYVVDHTPALFYKTSTISISEVVSRYLDELIEDKIGEVLKKCLIIENGTIKDQRIIDFQNR